jgi:hypothetical protein
MEGQRRAREQVRHRIAAQHVSQLVQQHDAPALAAPGTCLFGQQYRGP